MITFRNSLIILIAASFFTFSGCKEKDDPVKVLIITKDANGGEKVFAAPRALINGIFRNVVERSERSTLKSLNKDQEILQNGPESTKTQLDVTRVTLGLLLEAEGGIGDVVKLAGEAAFELRFEPLPKPIINHNSL